MKHLIDGGLASANNEGLTPVILAIPSAAIRRERVAALLSDEKISGLLLPAEVYSDYWCDNRIGQFCRKDNDWELPKVRGRAIVLAGGAMLLGVRRAWRALRNGITSVYHVDSLGKWHRVWLPRFIIVRGARRALGALLRWVNFAPVYNVVTLRDVFLVHELDQWLRTRRPISNANFFAGRLLVINTGLGPGGAERQIVNTVMGISARGYNVSILCNDLSSESGSDFYKLTIDRVVQVTAVKRMQDLLYEESTEALDLACGRLTSCGLDTQVPGLPAWVRDDLLAFAAEFAERGPQVVHLWQDYTNVVGGLAACAIGVPHVVLGTRSLAPYRFPYIQPFMRAAYKILADRPNVVLINNSEAGAADYAEWLGIPRERFTVVRNGIDDVHMQRATVAEIQEWKTKFGLPAEAPVVGSVYRFSQEKQPLLWVKTAAAVARRRSDVVFFLVGWGPMEEEIKAHAARAGIADRVFMPGPQKDVRSVVSCMDVFLLTSRVEGSPNVLLEAQMMGVPVVTTNAGGSAETLEHGRTGWVVPRDDADDLADRILAVLDDPVWAAEARALAPKRVAERFGFERMIDDTLRAYGMD